MLLCHGNSLVHTIGTGRDAFFNHTEGQSPALASGVTFSNKIVSLNLSALPKGTTAKLQLRLVNNDKDVNTIARISKIEVKSNSTFSPPVSVPLIADATAASIVDFHKLSDISNSITTTYGKTSFNADTEILYTDLAIKNAGQYPVKGKLLLGITNISDPTVKLRNIAGTTPTGIPYIDYSSLLEDGTLVPGETTQSKTLEFDNPNGVQFTYEKVFFSQLNTAPEFTSTANKEAIIGKTYLYDVDATDEDNDSLTYSLLSGPSGLSIDSTTGKITWNPIAENIGNHDIIIKVKDNFGGEATQQYNLSTINQPPNRPPVFTSIPIVDGKVNTPYKYQAIAKDIDGDGLTFSLLEAPDGMSVNPATGVVTWTPDGNQLGKVLVKLKVEDNAGGEAEQAFEILTQIEPGNHAPMIISAPITQFNFPGSANPDSGNVSPKAIDLNLEAGQVVQSPISLTLPSNDATSTADTVFVVDRSESMGGEFRWLGNILQDLDRVLNEKGINSNRYGIVTFDETGKFLNVPSAGNDLNFTLFGQNDQPISSRTLYGGDWPTSLQEFTLPQDGFYTLVVNPPFATTPFQYGFQLSTNPPTTNSHASLSIPSETTIQSLPLDTPITGTIGTANKKNIYTFDATPGTKIYYDSLESDFDSIYVSLLSPNGNSIIYESNSDLDNGFITLQEAGTYSLIFRNSGTTGDYKFQLLKAGEPQRLNFDTTITKTLNSGLETKLYHFDGNPGERLYFDSLDNNASGSWSLRDSGNQVLYNNYLNSDFQVTLPFDGSYTLILSGDNSSNPVDYSFQVQKLPIPPSNDLPPTQATRLDFNSPVIDSIATSAEQDIFTFEGTPGQQIYFDGLDTYNNYAYAQLVSPSGQTIFSTNTSTNTYYNSNLHVLTETGTYRLVLSYYQGTNYKFQLLEAGESQRLNFDTTITNTLNSGLETKLYHFDGSPGERLFFDSLPNATNNGYWYLYSPNHQFISSSYLGYDSEVTLPSQGRYTLLVNHNNSSTNSVDYSFRVKKPQTTTNLLNFNLPIAGEIAVPGERDVFTFSATPGTKIYYDGNTADSDSIKTTLVSPSGQTIFYSNSTKSDALFRPITLTEAGTYRLIVDGDSQTTGQYKFQLLATTPDYGLTNGQLVSGQLSGIEQTAFYYFNGTSGQKVTLAPHPDFQFGTASQASATANLIRTGKNAEDGYAAINAALNSQSFRPDAARNIILVTDEDRDIVDGNLNFSTILDALIAKNALLSTAVSANFINSSGNAALGLDASGNAYTADGTGGFTFTPGGQFIPPYYDDTTKLDYIDLAWATNGIAWNLNKLREGGTTAASFTQAFTSHLVEQIQSQLAIDVIPSDDTVSFTNLTGILNNVKPGDTAIFTASFTGDGNSHNFDLLFVRPGTNTILGSIPVTINSNAVYFYPVQAIDPDGDELTYSLISSPTGASIDAETGRISWKPTSAGNYNFEIQVSDSRGGITTQTYQLLVKSGGDNTNPEITSTAPTTAAINQTYHYQVTAEDNDSDRLSFYLVDPPENALIDKETGLLTWTPSAANESGQSLTVKVLDSRGGVATQTIQVNVLPDVENIAPQFDSQPIITSTLGQTYRYDPIVTDPNADRLQFDLVVKPEGMTVSTQTGTVVWQPNADQVGKHNVVLRVFDGRGGVDLQSYQINVQPANRPPAFTSNPSLQAIVGRAYQYPVRVIDADADSISFRLENAPDEMLVDEKGILSWTPTANYLGEQSVTIIASDGRGGEAKQTFNLNVVQDAPNSDPIITSTPRQVIGLGNNYFYQVEVDNADSDPLSYSLETHPAGMSIDEAGRIFWKPTSAQFGNNNVKIKVDDGRGGIDVQEFAVKVVSKTTNAAPNIDSTPPEAATVRQEYRYDLAGSDPDGDLLLWSLDAAPDGMSIDPERGTILWTPTADQVGEYEVAVRVVDSLGAYAGQAFTVTVRGVNVAPTIDSLPPTTAAINQVYQYAVLASDVENDKLTFSLNNPPSGMTIDADTGLIEWTPDSGQLGERNVEVLVEDSRGAIAKQKYRIFVKQTAENLAPTITSVPLNVAAVNQIYRYEITATEPEGEAVQYQLLEKPNGMMVDPLTGVVQWTPSEAGVYYVTVGAVDSSGAGGAQRFEINVAVNQVPVISSSPVESVTLGKTYRYDVKATDGNGDKLVYSLTNHPEGMEIDEWGRISWSPGSAGSFPVVVTVKDSRGASVSQPYSLSVVADHTAPKVNLWMNPFGSVDKGEDVSFVVSATDDVGVSATVLRVNGQVVPLDEQGRATVKMDTAGAVTAVATATDGAGNAGSASNSINVVDSSDIDAPQLEISSLEDDEIITAPIDIIGTVNDSNLSYYRLLVSPIDGGEEREVFRGTSQVTNGVLGKFDPSVLGNDSYILKLEAADAGGNVSSVERIVNVTGELKLGNFRLSFTDLSIPVAGIPISVTRTYDSLNANSKDDFGYGWRLEFRDTDLRTSLKKDETFEQLGVRTVAFKDKTRVYITLPGGKREAFTFKPIRDRLSGFLQAAAPPGVDAGIYHPVFEGDKGVTSKLTVVDSQLSHVGNEYFGLNGEPYNPADSAFGGKYVLTTKEGIVYEIDGISGDLLTATDTNGNKLRFTDAGIFSDSGKAISFGRDAGGRIVSVTDAMGYQVKYSYDEKGDLVKVTDQENRETKFIYDSQRTHYLKEIIDPLGRTGAKTEYDEKGRLTQVVNGANVPINMEYKPEESIQIVKDVYGKSTTSRYDERGNVLEVKDALGHSTLFEYDEDNNLTQSKDANNLVTKYEYDTLGNLISRTEAYCGCPTVVPGTTYYTYNQYGQPTSVVLPTGASMKMEYDRFGNMLSMKDGKGSVIQSFTYYPNGLVKTETDTTGTTSYYYDNFGNVTKSIDPDGKATTMEYFADGKLKKMVEDQGTTDTADDSTSTFTYDKLGREKRADYGNGIWVEYGYGVESDWSTLTAPTIGTIQRKFTDDGKLKGWVTPDGGTPTFLYDQAGRLWRETDATGKVTTEYGYDDAGRVTTVKDVRTGAITRKKYDAGNRPTEEIDPLGGYTKYAYHPQNGKVVTMERGKYTTNSSTGQLVVDPVTNQYVVDTTVQKQVWNYEYNGLQTTVIDPLGRKTTSVQDEYYLPTETIYKQREGKDWSTQTKYLYTNNLQEAKDYPTQIIDISGRDRDFTYDSLGRLWKATDLANNTYTYTYGDDGLELIESPTSQTNSVNIKETLRYGYDALGNLNKVTYGDGKIKQMNYRSNDNRLGTTTLPSGETITYDYDAAGRIKSETTKSAGDTITNTVSYIYDGNSNVKTVTDNTGTTTYRYDPNTGANIGIDYPNGSSIAYTHDLLGRVKTITEKASPTATAYVTTYDYDAFGNLKSVLDPSGNTTTMKYDVGNRLKERLLPNGVKSVYEYDELDRVKSLVHTNASGAVLASVAYERKGVGEPTKVTREDGSYVMLEYDEALRVKKESYYNAAGALQDETSYGYDAAGKRIVQSSTVSGSKSFNYKAGYQLDSISGAVSEDYDYDANGRLTLIVRDGKTLDLEHDATNRLTAVENETTGNTIRYTYDGQGRRVAASEGTSQRRFLVAPAMGGGLESTDLISDANGNLISNYVYAGGSSPFMRLDASGNPIYYLTDAMGSTIGLADGTGASAAKFNYDSFGNLRSSSGVAANTGIAGGDFRFQGQWLEQGTGIYHFRARDYDAKTGTFLSRDPVDIIETEPESFNPYQFVYHNPHVYSDPTGMIVNLSDVSLSRVIESTLQGISNNYRGQVSRKAINQAQGVLTDALSSTIRTLAPYDIDTGRLFDRYVTGGFLESILKNALCEIVGSSYKPLLSNIWLEPAISASGRAARDGFSCGPSSNQFRPTYTRIPGGSTDRGLSFPDFLIRKQAPTDGDRVGAGPALTTVPPAYLIGDFKRTTNRSTLKIGSNQWYGILNYAQAVWSLNRANEPGHQYVPVALYVTLESRKSQVAYARKRALQDGRIDLRIVSFFQK